MRSSLPWFAVLALSVIGAQAAESKPVGLQGVAGCQAKPKEVSRLEITKPGVYENYRINAQGKGGNIR